MGTRCNIIIEGNELGGDGVIFKFYRHWDGDPETILGVLKEAIDAEKNFREKDLVPDFTKPNPETFAILFYAKNFYEGKSRCRLEGVYKGRCCGSLNAILGYFPNIDDTMDLEYAYYVNLNEKKITIYVAKDYCGSLDEMSFYDPMDEVERMNNEYKKETRLALEEKIKSITELGFFIQRRENSEV